jgi:hypothetical protein
MGRQLYSLELSDNNITGGLPAAWARQGMLFRLGLARNGLAGSLPREWGRMRSLLQLDLAGNALSGALPAEWRALRHATSLDLAANRLSGVLPAAWAGMASLQMLSLQGNQLSGVSLGEECGEGSRRCGGRRMACFLANLNPCFRVELIPQPAASSCHAEPTARPVSMHCDAVLAGGSSAVGPSGKPRISDQPWRQPCSLRQGAATACCGHPDIGRQQQGDRPGSPMQLASGCCRTAAVQGRGPGRATGGSTGRLAARGQPLLR